MFLSRNWKSGTNTGNNCLFKTVTILFIICLSAFSKTLTVASYNVENLFDLNYDKTEYGAYTPGKWNLTSYKTKLKNIAFVISKINADIISLQEIESQTAIDDLNSCLKRNGLNYHRAFVKNPKQSVGLGLLSKYPVVNVLHYPVPNSRPIMRCDIAIDKDTVSVFSLHFPSKKHPESERIKAANVCRQAIDTMLANQNYEYYIAGDFNSDYDEFATSLSQGTDNSNGKTGINHVLKTLRGIYGRKPLLSLPPINSDEHFDPWTEVAANKRWSYIFRGNKNTLDHILFGQNMTDTINWRYVYGSFSHFAIPEIIKDGKPYNWRYNPNTEVHYNSGYSDHLAVAAKITNENISQSPKFQDEACLNGWITTHALAELKLVQNTTEGLPVYRLSAKKIPSAATVAKIVNVANKDYGVLNMAVRGIGNFSVRSRVNSDKNDAKWEYSSPAVKQITNQARYEKFKSENWTSFTLLPNVSAGDTVEIEIRVQKETPFNIQFCVED